MIISVSSVVVVVLFWILLLEMSKFQGTCRINTRREGGRVRTEAMQEVREGRWDKAGGKSEMIREETVVMMGWEALHKQQQQVGIVSVL